MGDRVPGRVLITGGRELGGVSSFAEGLRAGFSELGIPAEIVLPSRMLSRWRELRDPRVLKILSTTAVFAAPFARRSICMAHGVPRADAQGFLKTMGILNSYKLANLAPGAQLVAVSHYAAVTLRALFNIRIDAVVHNPVKPLYLEPNLEPDRERCYITYAGRLVAAKNLHRMIPAIRDLLDETPGLRACVIGEGPMRPLLEAMVEGDDRFEFKGAPADGQVRAWLRRTRVFLSGNEVEGFGITYLEAMTQGCVVVMPASGGGLEIALDKVGSSVQLLPLSWERSEVLAALRRALGAAWTPVNTESYTAKAAACRYLRADARFSSLGRMRRGRQQPVAQPLAEPVGEAATRLSRSAAVPSA
jgi:glycosyltransferase involved in cell wall biosynthesis